jgi:hypothetical protein
LFEQRTQDCGTAEKRVFAELRHYRRGKRGQEFFEVGLDLATNTIIRACESVDAHEELRRARLAEIAREAVKETQPDPAPFSAPQQPQSIPPQSTSASVPLRKREWPWAVLGWGVIIAMVASNNKHTSSSSANYQAPYRPPAAVTATVARQSTSIVVGTTPSGRVVVSSAPTPTPAPPAVGNTSVGARDTIPDNSDGQPPNQYQPAEVPMEAPRQLETQRPLAVELANISKDERSMIESACRGDRIFHGPADYYACQKRQLDALATAPRNVSLADESPDERRMIESACRGDRILHGPAAYDQCLTRQIGELESGERNIDLSAATEDERSMIESACRGDRILHGPASYNRCLLRQLDIKAAGQSKPDLSGISREDRDMIESACRGDRVLNGPAAYYSCLQRQVSALRRQATAR